VGHPTTACRILAVALGLTLLGSAPARANPGPPEPSVVDTKQEAALVDSEDQRIIQTRSVLSSILQVGGAEAVGAKRPQVFGSAYGKTLVLPERASNAPYTVADLVKIPGGYFQRLPDGSYLLGAHLFVAAGAELRLTSPLTLRMGSIPGSFSSIVSFGGVISVIGTAPDPVRITSWNPQTGQSDTKVDDGRAYIRAIGGQFRMDHAEITDLGFWSGRTGGIALTGTERPVSVTKHLNKAQRHEAKQQRLAKNKNPDTAQSGGGPGDLEIEPAGPDAKAGTASHVPAADLVTGSIQHSTITGNAYGVFVSGSDRTQILGDRIADSLVHGVLLHRYTKNATIQDTTVTGSGGDGFVLSRATQSVRITGCTSEGNGGNGFTLNGQPLAGGPSASGESLQAFGNSSVNGSIARGNHRYGVELLGGTNLAVQTSKIYGGDMGIVVRAGATGVQISGNELTGQARQGIALRDGVTGAQVAGNTITGVRTGIYLRDSNGDLVGNTVHGATAHAITLRGAAGGSRVTGNTLDGTGTSAVSSAASHGRVAKSNNHTDGWHDTSTFLSKAKEYVKPMNVIWTCVLLLVLLAMFRSRGTGRRRTRQDPYKLQRPLAERPADRLRDLLNARSGI
jgi:parallel beta-helix repeat protein